VSGQGLSKAVIVVKETDAQIPCRFNPSEYTVSKSATWSRTPIRGAETASIPEFVGTNPRTLQLELLFDGWDSGGGDVSGDVEALMECTNPTRKSISDNRPSPPVVLFQWGTKPLFDAYVKSVSARYTMFQSDGTPIRALVTVAFEEIPSQPGRQNPTSGGSAGRRTRLVQAGESLHAIAYQEYRKPTLWRGLALFNGITDPARLRSGTTLIVPPAGEAAVRS
jgi:hypothetical protein